MISGPLLRLIDRHCAASKPMNNRRTGSPISSPRLSADEIAVALVDIGAGRWRVAMHFRAAPDEKIIRALTAAAAGNAAAKALRFERVAAKDWVRESLAGLAPVDGRPLHRARRP